MTITEHIEHKVATGAITIDITTEADLRATVTYEHHATGDLFSAAFALADIMALHAIFTGMPELFADYVRDNAPTMLVAGFTMTAHYDVKAGQRPITFDLVLPKSNTLSATNIIELAALVRVQQRKIATLEVELKSRDSAIIALATISLNIVLRHKEEEMYPAARDLYYAMSAMGHAPLISEIAAWSPWRPLYLSKDPIWDDVIMPIVVANHNISTITDAVFDMIASASRDKYPHLFDRVVALASHCDNISALRDAGGRSVLQAIDLRICNGGTSVAMLKDLRARLAALERAALWG